MITAYHKTAIVIDYADTNRFTTAIVVLDITGTENGNSPNVVDFYLNPKDRGPEGILFIPAEKSPNGEPLLVVGYEYSKTLAVYSVK